MGAPARGVAHAAALIAVIAAVIALMAWIHSRYACWKRQWPTDASSRRFGIHSVHRLYVRGSELRVRTRRARDGRVQEAGGQAASDAALLQRCSTAHDVRRAMALRVWSQGGMAHVRGGALADAVWRYGGMLVRQGYVVLLGEDLAGAGMRRRVGRPSCRVYGGALAGPKYHTAAMTLHDASRMGHSWSRALTAGFGGDNLQYAACLRDRLPVADRVRCLKPGSAGFSMWTGPAYLSVPNKVCIILWPSCATAR